MSVADTLLEGLTEEEVQHVREKAENLLAEMHDAQRALGQMRLRPYAGPGEIAIFDARRASLKRTLTDRTEEYRRLTAAVKAWEKQRNITRSNDDQRQRFLDIRDTAGRALGELRRRQRVAPEPWAVFADQGLTAALNDLVEAVGFYSGREPEDGERFSAAAPPRPTGGGGS